MSPLNDADSRRLFIRRIFHSDSSCPPQLEEVLANILRKCGGLPMAIITIARLLANKTHKLEEWEGRLQESIGNGFSYESDDAVKNMRHTLLLSYWELPHYLKTCLLYLYIYPEGWYISCEELKWKWIAEGFIATQRGNLYLEAHNCFNELVNRSMIQLVDAGDDGFEKYCQVHDMVLHLIVSLSCEENFATVLNSVCNSLPSKIRRLSLHSNGLEQNATIHAITRSKPHVCSLNVFGETADMPPLVEFPSLRVFDICNGFSSLENEHIRNIGSLYQLRYLRTQGLGITEIPDDIGKLQNLEILDLRGTSIRKLPPTITRLHKLVCLFVDYHEFVFPADIFGSMRALEEVSDICKVDNPEKFLEELRHLTKLRKISMSRLWISRLDHHSLRCYRERLGSSLNEMGQYNLQCLHAVGKVGEYLFRDTCCTFPHLQDLKLGSCMLRVPKGMASLTNILKLQIEIAIFDEESLHILMEMPALAYLQLKVSKSAGIMTVSSTGFKLLEVFRYSIHEEEATGIEFAVGAMPTLRRLHLSWNAYYVMFRYNDGADMGIEHLSSLAHLEVETGCCNATLEEVEAVGASFEKAIALHPNRHTLQLHLRRKYEDKISKKREKERERRRRKGDYAPRSSISPQQQEDQVI